jgi:hypothetical protein
MTQSTSWFYIPLDASSSEIQLLTIHPGTNQINCTIKHNYLEHIPAYEALSYFWGDASDKSAVLANETQFEVTANLASAPRYLRADGP